MCFLPTLEIALAYDVGACLVIECVPSICIHRVVARVVSGSNLFCLSVCIHRAVGRVVGLVNVCAQASAV